MRRITIGVVASALLAGAAAAQTRDAGTQAASGDANQAVATTSANAPAPAHGRNSFSRGEAMRRLAARGFTNVQGLHKDGHGVWRGTAEGNGASGPVWLDYKGNTGTGAG